MFGNKLAGIFHNIFGPQGEDGPRTTTRLPSYQSAYRPPVCKTLEDLARLTLDDPTEEELHGFRACLEAIRAFPECFIEMAWTTNKGWCSYHALDEVNETYTPIAKAWVGIVAYALAIQDIQQLKREAEDDNP